MYKMRCNHCRKSLAFKPDLLTKRERLIYNLIVKNSVRQRCKLLWRQLAKKAKLPNASQLSVPLKSLARKGYIEKLGRFKGVRVLEMDPRPTPRKRKLNLKWGELKCPHCNEYITKRPKDLRAFEWELLLFLIGYSHATDRSPTRLDVMIASTSKSTSTIEEGLSGLAYKGYIIRYKGQGGVQIL
jgi:SOS-response transcriptional repressor LexA